MARLLVVDDELGVRESLRMLFKGEHQVLACEGVEPALRILEETQPDVVILDLVMPGRSGLELLGEIEQRPDAPPVLVLSATRTVATAVEAMKRGAADYVTKPFEIEALRLKVARLLERRALEAEVERLRSEVDGRSRLGRLLGRSEPMQRVFRVVERVCASPSSVLVSGESGTGKELVARALHELGPRRDGPFVAVDCAAIPDTLIESELFGHERGAFTDARERRIGRFEAASGGTLFLDEIGELAPQVQAKLLRVLQERRVQRLGGDTPIAVDVRVVAATNRDLEREVAEGRFRDDLYYRIRVVPIGLAPLRERRGDVRLLAEHFLGRRREAAGRGPVRFAPQAMAALEAYSWPGNVRELENAVERAVALGEAEEIRVEDLPEEVVQGSRLESLRESVNAGRLAFEQAVSRFERALLHDALEGAGWNQTLAAQRLGVTRRVLKLKMDRLGLAPPASV